MGQPKNQEAHPTQDPLDEGHDDGAPEGGFDGHLGFPQDLVVVLPVQGGKLFDGLNKGVSLQEHEKGDE